MNFLSDTNLLSPSQLHARASACTLMYMYLRDRRRGVHDQQTDEKDTTVETAAYRASGTLRSVLMASAFFSLLQRMSSNIVWLALRPTYDTWDRERHHSRGTCQRNDSTA